MTYAQKRALIVEMKIAESRAWLESEQAKYAAEMAMIEAMDRRAAFLAGQSDYNAALEESRAEWAAWQTEPSSEYEDHNDQDGSFLNDDYCDRLEQENHD